MAEKEAKMLYETEIYASFVTLFSVNCSY